MFLSIKDKPYLKRLEYLNLFLLEHSKLQNDLIKVHKYIMNIEKNRKKFFHSLWEVGFYGLRIKIFQAQTCCSC